MQKDKFSPEEVIPMIDIVLTVIYLVVELIGLLFSFSDTAGEPPAESERRSPGGS